MAYSLASCWRRTATHYVALPALALLSACTTVQQPEHAPEADVVKPDIAQVSNQLAERQAERREQRQNQITGLLAEADRALSDNRLTLPEHDNAYDRFQAVLLLDRDNGRAKAGLDSILLRYVGLIREALRNNRIARARQLLNQAKAYYGDNPLLGELQAAVSKAEAQSRRRMQALSEQQLEGTEFDLPPRELSRKSGEVIEFLGKVAKRLRETDESVLIKARSDAEGRWIYQQMKEAVPDYRIRGDIRVVPQPGLSLLPPL